MALGAGPRSYGSLTIAEVLPADGKMISCEIDPFLKEFSKPFFDKSPHGHKVDVRIGPALETMRAYDADAEGGGCDMIFIDADKGGYAGYYEAALSTPGLLADGGTRRTSKHAMAAPRCRAH